MKEFLERLKSPVVWSVAITVTIAQLEQLQCTDMTAKQVLTAAMIIALTVFGAINNPTDRDNI
ncbi:MAG: hypothetical protein E7546_06940 [Ruminococcaceae bacterium]|nr:hypothetical protein [Oscillospiraceae bacterium]